MIKASKKNSQSLFDVKLAAIHFPFPTEPFRFKSYVSTEVSFFVTCYDVISSLISGFMLIFN